MSRSRASFHHEMTWEENDFTPWYNGSSTDPSPQGSESLGPHGSAVFLRHPEKNSKEEHREQCTMKVTMEEEAVEEGSPSFPFQIHTQEQKWENSARTMLAVAALNCNAPESESSTRSSLDHKAQSTFHFSFYRKSDRSLAVEELPHILKSMLSISQKMVDQHLKECSYNRKELKMLHRVLVRSRSFLRGQHDRQA